MENSDRHIIAQVEGVLSQDPRVRLQGSGLLVGSEAGYVTLSGLVPTVAAKRVAARLASGVSGVKTLHDETRVETPNPMGDLEIAEHVRRSFIAERNIEEGQIDIETDTSGGVTLRGSVRSLAQVRLCEVLCWWVRGVTEVHNLLVVSPPEEDNDEELKDNLITIMEKDFLVNPKKFRVEVRQGIVTLRGQAGSEIEKDAAEKDCWYTPGVIDVVNELSIA